MDEHRLQNDTILTDDAVAELLAEEASSASIKYSSMGLEAFRSVKYVFRASNAQCPTPNVKPPTVPSL